MKGGKIGLGCEALIGWLVERSLEMFYLNTIEQLFLSAEQLDMNINTGGIPKFKVEFN